jgi:hypothetical protein
VFEKLFKITALKDFKGNYFPLIFKLSRWGNNKSYSIFILKLWQILIKIDQAFKWGYLA